LNAVVVAVVKDNLSAVIVFVTVIFQFSVNKITLHAGRISLVTFLISAPRPCKQLAAIVSYSVAQEVAIMLETSCLTIRAFILPVLIDNCWVFVAGLLAIAFAGVSPALAKDNPFIPLVGKYDPAHF
jgi:hypothetical protein